MARCIAPILAKGSTRKNPVWVPCGYCGYCLINRKQEWKFRLQEEFKISTWSWFITLTYAPQHLPKILDPLLEKHFDMVNEMTLCTRHVQLFTKKLRKLNAKYTKLQLRYYACGEYGERFGRPHYHFIIFNLTPQAALEISRLWGMGYCKIELVRTQTKVSNYVSGYVIKNYKKAKTLKVRPMALMSKKPYLGHSYVQRMSGYHLLLNEPFLTRGEIRQRLPKIFKRKIWSTAQPDPLGGEWKFAPSCTLPGCTPEKPTKYYDPGEKLIYTPPSNWKIEAELQAERNYQAKLHELKLKNGPDYDAESYLAHEQHYNEQRIFLNFKCNDLQ